MGLKRIKRAEKTPEKAQGRVFISISCSKAEKDLLRAQAAKEGNNTLSRWALFQLLNAIR